MVVFAVAVLSIGMTAAPAAAAATPDRTSTVQSFSPFAEFVPPSLNGQGCPTYAARPVVYGYFSYDLIRIYTPNGGLIYIGVYGTRLHFNDGTVAQTGIREYTC
jgi:hypothetical protein